MEFFGEARQEAGRHDRAAIAAAGDVSHVGEVAVQPLLIIVPQRQFPDPVAGSGGGDLQGVSERRVIAEQPVRMSTQRNDAGPGQGRDINDGGGLVALGVAQRIAQDQPALGVGIENFDRLPGQTGDDVARPGRLPSRHIFHRRDQTGHVQR